MPLNQFAALVGQDIKTDTKTNTITITAKKVVTPKPTPSPTPIPTATPVPTPLVISKTDLPYTINASNGMSVTFNSYTASTGGITFNITHTNNSTVSDKGDDYTSTWEIYDGKNTLNFLNKDSVFYDSNYIRSGQSITGDVNYKGLSQQTDTFILYGSQWQYIDAEYFKLTFKVE